MIDIYAHLTLILPAYIEDYKRRLHKCSKHTVSEKKLLLTTALKILNKVMMWMKASFASLLLVALLHSTIAAPR